VVSNRWIILVALLQFGCSEGERRQPPHPRLLVRPEHRPVVLERAGREPYATILAGIGDIAAREYREDPDPGHWDVFANGRNASVAQANALLAWLLDDQAAAARVRDFLDRLQTDFETHERRSDIDVNMPQVLQGYTNAWDLLMATPYFPTEEAEAAAGKIADLAGAFYALYLEDELTRLVQFNYSQNNHNIRAASALGYVAAAFPELPDARDWANWAFSELDFFWRPEGMYLLPDGGVSEGPFYAALAWQSSATTFIAMDNLFDAPPSFSRDCRTRIDSDPWQDHGCVERERFSLGDFVRDPLFQAVMDWYICLRLPWGPLPPLGDGMFKTYAGSAFLSSFGGAGHHWWAWAHDRDFPCWLEQSDDLSIHHLVYLDDAVAAAEPPWTTRFLPESGNAVFRSDWGYDARWLLLVAEGGTARKAAHDHVDGTSISLAAYGEYLLVDPGYVKDESSAIFKVKTAVAPAHNLVLIEGQAAPEKKPFPLFGDADAFLRNTLDGEILDYAEAHQDYQESHLERSVAFVEGRYFVVADRIQTDRADPREHAWRMSGYAGYGSGGLFELRADGARWERPRAGVDVYLACTAPALSIVEPPFTAGEVPHVHRFDLPRQTTEHAVIDGRVLALAPGYLALLLPYRVTATDPLEGPLPAQALSLGEGIAAWTVQYGQATDLALLREPGSPQSFTLSGNRSLETDAELVILRLSGPRPFALMVRGTQLTLDGTRLAYSPGGAEVVLEENPD
jgi:hypothetical protein